MAVTYAVSSLTRNVEGAKRVHRGTITATGTYTSGGDAVTPALFGLSTIENLDLTVFNDGSATVPVHIQAIPVRTSDISWLITFADNVVGAVNTGTIAAGKSVTLTAAETITGYKSQFCVVGR